MKIYGFLKLLNMKIKKYDKATTNPFVRPNTPITIVWVEKTDENSGNYKL